MKKVNLRQALKEIKAAKTLTQRLAATSKLVNQTAYEAGKILYGVSPPEQPKSSTSEQLNTLRKPETNSKAILEPAPSAQTAHKKSEVSHFDQGLININEELKALRLAKEKAYTDVESNAILFKILRLERERRKLLTQRQSDQN